MEYSTKQKKEVRDYLSQIRGVHFEILDPGEMEDADIAEIRRSALFRVWLGAERLARVLRKIRNAIIKRS